jgi:hypothetical protein
LRRGTTELAGPEQFRLNQIVQRALAASGDGSSVTADPQARYFGAELNDGSLVPGAGARLGGIRYEAWLQR